MSAGVKLAPEGRALPPGSLKLKNYRNILFTYVEPSTSLPPFGKATVRVSLIPVSPDFRAFPIIFRSLKIFTKKKLKNMAIL